MDGTFNNGSLGLYLIAGAVILFVLIQSIFFLVKAWKQGKKLGLDKSKLRNAVTSSALFTIPSALSVLATVIALAPALGLVIPWVRLSVIGNLMYETTAAEAAMEAFGHKGGIANAVTDPTVYAGIAWVMTLGICFSLVILPFLAKPLHKKFMAASNKEKVNEDADEDEVSETKPKRTIGEFINKFATPAIFIGLIGAFIARAIAGQGSTKVPEEIDGAGVLSLSTLIVAIVVSILLEVIVKKLKLTWLEPFVMPIGMIVAMVAAIVLYNVLPADIATLEWRG
ncbi:MAG: DUF5058 family protein [Acutalibacteraceae bacterium]|nr:DUF5058 family protein [Acutalibacteraceae bacterium]